MGIVVLGAVFVDIKGYPLSAYIPGGRNAGRVDQVHGGVSRNIAEDIANVELRPTFVSLVDNTGIGTDVIDKLNNHKVNTDYILRTPDGLGTWLAVFDNDGEVCAAISKRPDTSPLTDLLEENREAGAALCQKIRQKGVFGCFQHEHCHGAARLFAADRLLCVQPAGGRAFVFG